LAGPGGGRRHVVQRRHRLVEGRDQHPVRALEPGQRGAVLRRPLRGGQALRTARTLPGPPTISRACA
jgi:hypothetical protein